MNKGGWRHRLLVATALFGVAATGCSPIVAVRGNMPDVEDIAVIRPGVDTRQDVIETLGSPSTLSTFEARTWFYIGQRTEQVAFFAPEVVDRSVFVVKFDSGGMVDETKLYTLHDGKVIDPVSRETPTEGRELTILQQIFGNLGRLPGALGDEGTNPGGP